MKSLSSAFIVLFLFTACGVTVPDEEVIVEDSAEAREFMAGEARIDDGNVYAYIDVGDGRDVVIDTSTFYDTEEGKYLNDELDYPVKISYNDIEIDSDPFSGVKGCTGDAAQFSESGRYLAVLFGCGGGYGLGLYDTETEISYNLGSYAGSFIWEGDELVIDTRNIFEQTRVLRSVSADEAWTLECSVGCE